MRRAAWIAGALLLALALAAAARKPITEWYVTRALAHRGMDADLEIVSLGARGALISPLRISLDAVVASADRIELAWDLRDLLAGRFERVALSGVTIGGDLTQYYVAIGGDEAAESQPRALPVLPMNELAVSDLTLDVDTGQGRFALTGAGEGRFRADALSGRFAFAGDTPYGPVESRLELAGTYDAPEARFELEANPEAGKLKLEQPLRAQGRLHTDENGAVRWQATGVLPFLDWPELARLEEIALEAEGDTQSVRGKLRVARAIDVREPALLAPLSVELDFEGPFDALAFTGRAQTGDGAVRATLKGTLAPPERRADVSFRVPETELTRERQAGSLSPRIAEVVRQAKGHIGATGDARFENGALRYRADVALRELDARLSGATLRGVTGAVTFEGPPLSTPPGQLLSIAAIEEPLPLSNGLVEFQLVPDGAVSLASAVFSAAKGTLRASGRLPLDAQERSLELIATDLDVTSLLAALPFDALSGTGTLAGTLPLRQRGARVRIENGALRATVPGVIRYRPVAGSEIAAEQNAKLGTVLGALEELHYESLELDISGDTAEELQLAVRVSGSNPNFQQGRAVNLNVNVEARLGDLVKVGQAAYRVPGEVEERVERILDRER